MNDSVRVSLDVRSRVRAGWLLVLDAAGSLLQRPGHTVGMISGITLGVAAAIGAIVIADTQQAQVDIRFDLQRSDVVAIRSETPTRSGFDSDRIALAGQLEPVASIGEFSVWSDAEPVTRSIPSTKVAAPVVVADAGGIEATGSDVVAGAPSTLLSATPHPSGPTPLIAWVGEDLARRLGVAPVRAERRGDAQILVRGVPFSVAGIVANQDGFGYLSDAVLLSRQVAVAALGGTGSNVRVLAHVRPGSAEGVADHLLRALDPTGELFLTDVTPPDGKILLGEVGGDLRRIGVALGGFIGLVGMIAVANTLMMSVHQRRRELGLRSAIGWSRRRIGLLVLTEAVIAGFGAGVLGSAIGLGAAAAWCWLQNWTLVVPTALPLLVTGGGMLASLVGGVIPAYRAASISPMTAMRS